MVKARIVLKNFDVKHVLVGIAEADGKKTALDKSLTRFTGGNERALEVLKAKTQASRGMLATTNKFMQARLVPFCGHCQ